MRMGLLRHGARVALALSLLLGGCRRAERVPVPAESLAQQAVIREIQEFEKSFGFEATGSFSRSNPTFSE